MDSNRNCWRQSRFASGQRYERQVQHPSVKWCYRFEIVSTTRCGIGYDVHRLGQNRKLILGGLEIPYLLGLEGHSDADVLSHAIADALLGAICAGDIGQHFPNTDESILGISSIKILQRVTELLSERKARVINVDATITAEAPKIAPHISAMREKIAAAIGV